MLKALEHRLRRLAPTGAFAGRLVDTPIDLIRLPAHGRILLVRLERIGDVLVGIPVVRALRRRYPEARLTVLLSRNNYGVREALRPWVDEVLCYRKTPASLVAVLAALRRHRPDVAVDLVDNPSVSSRLFIRASGARRTVGLFHAGAGQYSHAAPLLDPAVSHPVERLAQLLLPFGLDPAATPLELEYRIDEAAERAARSLLGSSRRRRLGVNISGRSIERYWGRDNFSALLRQLAAELPQLEPVIFGAPADADEVATLATDLGARAVPATGSFHAFAAALHRCDMILTPDTSVVHLAAAWKTPTVALYHAGPSQGLWLPYRTPHRALRDARDLRLIPRAEVAAAVTSLYHEVFGPDGSTDRGPAGSGS